MRTLPRAAFQNFLLLSLACTLPVLRRASCTSAAWLEPRPNHPEPAPGCHLVEASGKGWARAGEAHLPRPTPAADPLKPFANISEESEAQFPSIFADSYGLCT